MVQTNIVTKAVDFGFSHCDLVSVSTINFMSEVRNMCKVHKCKRYGRSWMCPPACGTLDDCINLADNFEDAIIVQTTSLIVDDFDIESIQNTANAHKKNFSEFYAVLKNEFDRVIALNNGSCNICEKCTYPNSPCRFPEKAISSMESYGIWINNICEINGIEYYYGKGTITYTSCYLVA